MSKRDADILYFISFCIENYKKKIHATGNEVMNLFDKYGVNEYLYEHFEVLHTQSVQWMMEEIDEFIKKQE
ncbi:MAG: DUF3791 domain-containing protein [Bacteroides sp.]|nr:DUF3791 domain-containing protein [Bacteroides sp.]